MIRSRSYFTRSATFNAVFNYTFGRGKRPHQGPFNETTQNVLGYWSLSRSLNPLYKDGTALIRRGSDNETTIVKVNQETGIADPEQVRAFNGWNLLTYTNELDHTSWNKDNATAVLSAEALPTGLTHGFLVTETAASGAHGLWRVAQSGTRRLIVGERYTASIWVKPAGRTNIRLFDSANAVFSAAYNLQTGTVTTVSSTGANVQAQIVAGTNGWFQLIFSWTEVGEPPASTLTRVFNVRFSNGASESYLGETDKGFYLSSPQIERASSFSTYEPRTTTAAGDSFLVTLYEQAESGRNLLARTEEFDDSAWTKAGTSVSANTTINPVTGLTTADTLTEDTSTGAHTINATVPLVSGVTYTSSVYVKSNGRTSVSYRNDNDNATFIVNLTDGSVSSPVNCTATAIDAGGGWWRLVMTFTAIATGSRSCSLIRLRNDAGSTSYTGDGASGVLVWGAQVEVGSTATTYEKRTDRGAVRLDFTQSTTTLQPIVCEQGVVVTENNRLAAKFVAADARRMSIASSTAMFNALHTTGGSILLVSKANDTAAAKQILRNYNSSTGSGFELRRATTERFDFFAQRIGGAVPSAGQSITVNTSDGASTSQSVAAFLIDPDNATAASRFFAWQNGTSLTGANAQTGDPAQENAQANLTLGASPAGTEAHDGTISELALFSSLLSTADRLKYEANASRHYGITITESLVSISAHPSSVTTTIDYPYTMTVVASNATAYQWQYSTDGGTTWLPGNSNTDSITVTTTSNMNGWQWRCVVMNPFGGVISNAATVTVELLALEGLSIVSNLGGAWSTSRRLLPSYPRTSEVILIRRDSDNATLPIAGDGLLSEIDPNEIRTFNGWNRLTQSDKLFGGSWSGVSFGAGSVPVATENAGLSPFGTNTATRIQLDCVDDTLNGNRSIWRHASYSVTSGVSYTCSFWIKAYDVANVGKTVRFICEGATSQVVVTLTSDWQFVSATGTTSSTSVNFIIETRGVTTSQAADILVSHAQSERAAAFSTYEPRTTTGAGSSFLVTKYDQTGQARHFTQATTTLQPIVCEQGVPVTEGGRLSAKYVAADARRLSIPSSTAMFNYLHTLASSALFVCKFNDTAATKTVLCSKSGETTESGVLYRCTAGESVGFIAARLNVGGSVTNGTSINANELSTSPLTNQLMVFKTDPSAASCSVHRNGSSLNISTSSSGVPFVDNANNDLHMGARPSASLPHDGTISEVVIAPGLISDSDRDAWESRTGSFFGVSVS